MSDIKPVFWIGKTKEVLSRLHEDVRDAVGQALFEAQRGGKHARTKPLAGHGDARVLEIVVDHAGNTFRAVYTVRWPDCLYVVHVFQKKPKSGIKTPRTELDVIEERLKRIGAIREDRTPHQRGNR